MPKPSHTGACNYENAKRGDFQVCTRVGCKERFPCAGNSCGHLDCIEAREKPPKCYYCEKLVEGARGEDWGTFLVHGHTRAGHYTCRDKHASPADRARTGAVFNP